MFAPLELEKRSYTKFTNHKNSFLFFILNFHYFLTFQDKKKKKLENLNNKFISKIVNRFISKTIAQTHV
jgi:hypothetical protein